MWGTGLAVSVARCMLRFRVSMARTFVPTPADRFTFGLWTVGHRGADPFGLPTRPVLDPLESVRKLGEIGAYGVNLHDNDLVPIDASARRSRSHRPATSGARRRTRGSWCRWRRRICSPIRCSGTARSRHTIPAVRAYALQKTLAAIDLGVELGARTYVFWGGREGAEVDAAKDPVEAIKRFREALNFCCAYVRDRQVRPAICARSQAERAARRSLLSDHAGLPGVHRHAGRSGDGGRESRGRARADGRPELRARRRAGHRGRQAVPHRSERPEVRPVRSGPPLRIGIDQDAVLCWSSCSRSPATTARGISTRTRIARKAPTACGTSRAAACGRI